MQDLKSMEIFSKIDDSGLEKVRSLFSSEPQQQGTPIIRHGEPVGGLYIVEEGEVAVSLPGFEGVLATLGAGKSFGELSLFNDADTASATVTVSSATAVLSFCSRNTLNQALSEDLALATGFYYGSALLVADRLRSTNLKISGEIAKSMRMARTLIEEISTSGNLGFAQQQIETAGTNIVSGMTDILKQLLVMKQSGEDIPHTEITELADMAKNIYYSEFQVFEKVHEQLKILGQHLDNVNRILTQQEVLDVEEDMSLLDL